MEKKFLKVGNNINFKFNTEGTIKPHARSCKENNHKNVKNKLASDDYCCAGC